MQNKIKKILMCILILALSIPATLAKDPVISKAVSDKSTDMILYVGERYNIADFFGDIYTGIPNPGKYIISDSNVVGIEGHYSKNERDNQGWLIPEGYYSYIVALHTGKSTVTVVKGSKALHKYNITVKNREITSPTQYSHLATYYMDYPEKRIGRKPDKNSISKENTVKKILKSLDLESYNTDGERLFTLAKWFNDSKKSGIGADQEIYGFTEEGDDTGLVSAGLLLLHNMRFEIREGGTFAYSWPEIYIDEKWYKFNVVTMSFWEFSNYTMVDCFIDENGSKIPYVKDTKTHLPSMLIDIETKQQNILVGQSQALPIDRLSHNAYSSDISVVDVKDGKLIGKGAGIAIVYRYDDTYCDAFYVVVEPKITVDKKTVTLKKSKKLQKSYKSISPYRRVVNDDLYKFWVWEVANLYRLEPALSSEARLSTIYDAKTGYLSAYVVKTDGSKKLIFDDKDVHYGDKN